jgi:hypothetical protein
VKFQNPPLYNVQQLEMRAGKLLIDALGRDFQIAVDVELILERMEGVTLDVWPGLKCNHQTEGMVCRDIESGQLFVYIDEALADDYRYKARYRMTVGEELGHVVLHKSVIEQVETPQDFLALQRHSQWHEMDRHAKRFACAVLMPPDRLLAFARELYPQLVKVAGFGNVQAILKQITAQAASKFEVSPQTMGFRLKEWPARIESLVEQSMREQLDCI